MTKIQSIIIVGGGTSAWLTASYLIKNLTNPVKITLIESTKLGPIGVGEGTQPFTTTFLRKCGFEPRDWMPFSDATYKLGVEFVGWHNNSFFVDNDSVKTHNVGNVGLSHKLWVGENPSKYYDWLPAYTLAKNNVSPKVSENLDFVITNTNSAEAVHFNAIKLGKTLRSLIKEKINYYDCEVIEIVKDKELGIKELKLSTGKSIFADMYIDCTGFKSLLLEKSLDIPHISINDLLPCDKAVAIPSQYCNPEKECHPYTKATAMTAGWRWTIPTFKRIGNGYVYSSLHISKEDAENELRNTIKEYSEPALHLDMKCGYKETIAVKNVIAVGLSAGFVEPLEATGITFTTKTVEMLVHYLNSFDGNLNDHVRTNLNSSFVAMVKEIISFVFLHYITSSKRDTDFWKKFDDISYPDFIKKIYSKFIPYPPNELTNYPFFEMFHSGQWFQILNACGQYSNLTCNLSPEEMICQNIHKEMLLVRTNLEIEKFPNHYKFLKNWYNDLK